MALLFTVPGFDLVTSPIRGHGLKDTLDTETDLSAQARRSGHKEKLETKNINKSLSDPIFEPRAWLQSYCIRAVIVLWWSRAPGTYMYYKK